MRKIYLYFHKIQTNFNHISRIFIMITSRQIRPLKPSFQQSIGRGRSQQIQSNLGRVKMTMFYLEQIYVFFFNIQYNFYTVPFNLAQTTISIAGPNLDDSKIFLCSKMSSQLPKFFIRIKVMILSPIKKCIYTWASFLIYIDQKTCPCIYTLVQPNAQ